MEEESKEYIRLLLMTTLLHQEEVKVVEKGEKAYIEEN